MAGLADKAGARHVADCLGITVEAEAVKFLRRELKLPGLVLYWDRETKGWGIGWREGYWLVTLATVTEARSDGGPLVTTEVIQSVLKRFDPHRMKRNRQLLQEAVDARKETSVQHWDDVERFERSARQMTRGRLSDHPMFVDTPC